MNDGSPDITLSELQLALMRVLWERGEASTAEVADALRESGRALAHTTVATLLSRLEKRGLVASSRASRQLQYHALVAEHQVQKAMVSGLLSSLFGGRASDLLSHLLHAGEVGDEDLAQMRQLLDADRKGKRHV